MGNLKRYDAIFPRVYFQMIFSKNGKVERVEILSRDFEINRNTDIFLFYYGIEKILDYWETVKKLNLKVHVNLFPSSIKSVPFCRFPREVLNRLVVEVVEEDVSNYLDDILHLKETGVEVVLDDFGVGSSNFYCLKLFQTVKIDGVVVKKLPEIIPLLRSYGVEKVIVEKVGDFSLPADYFQAFSLHVPEPIERVVERLRQS